MSIVELIEKRELNSKVYDIGDNKFIYEIHAKEIHYKDKGSFLEKNSSFNDTHSSRGIEQYLSNKNYFSVGFRKDLISDKYYGIRRNSDQYEVTVKEIQINDLKVDIPKEFLSITKINDFTIEHNINNIINLWAENNNNGLITALRINSWLYNFKIVEQINLTGFIIKNKLNNNEYELINNCFIFIASDGKELIIPQPCMWCNSNISNGIKHSLYIENNCLLYKKELTNEGKIWLSENSPVYYIDTTTIYSSSSDGYVLNSQDKTDWTTVRGATSGTTSNYIGTNIQATVAYTNNSAKGRDIDISRSFLYFDTSSISGNITSAKLKLYIESVYANGNTIMCEKGTQSDTLVAGDFDAFSGSSYGNISASAGSYNDITFNSTGISDINTSGITKVCVREYAHDYSNSEPSITAGTTANYGVVFRSANYSGTDYDPILEIEVEQTTVPVLTITNYTTTRISSISGKDSCTVTFQSDTDLLNWIAKADGSGHTTGTTVGSGTTASASTDVQFVVDDEELTSGDKEYVITVYGQNAAGWSDE